MNGVILASGEGGVGVKAAIDALHAGASPIAVVESGLRIVEADRTIRTVGLGGAPNIRGEVECRLSCMCWIEVEQPMLQALVLNSLYRIGIGGKGGEPLSFIMPKSFPERGGCAGYVS